MDNKDKYSHKLDKNSVENLVNEFIKKICDSDKTHNTLENKLKYIDVLIDNLIDYCIKKKIFYYIENKISYSNIINHFKTHLIKFIKNLVDPNDTIINKYLNQVKILNESDTSNNNWDNVSDINSIMFKNFKNLNESFEKNVSFKSSEISITNYEEPFDRFEYNYSNKDETINNNLIKMAEDYENTNNNNNSNNNLALYIKLLINQNKYILEFIDKLTFMCKILTDPEKKYKKSNPFE